MSKRRTKYRPTKRWYTGQLTERAARQALRASHALEFGRSGASAPPPYAIARSGRRRGRVL